MKALVTSVVIVIGCSTAAFAQATASGTWRVEGTRAPATWEVTLRQAGSALIGIVSSCNTGGTRAIVNGRRSGQTIEFLCRRSLDLGDIAFTGRLDGEDMHLTWELKPPAAAPGPAQPNQLFGPDAPRSFTAKRVPDG